MSGKYNKALINREFIRELATETAADVYRVQTSIARAHKNTGRFYRFLSQNPLLEGALITTYTYSPLWGLTSQTGPDGHTIKYEYDIFGRLKQSR